MAHAKVVVVDDEQSNLALLDRLLRSAGISAVHTLQDPRQAVPCCLEVDAHLLLLDLHMQPVTGLDVIAELQASLPPRAFLPVIVLTADATPETRRAVLAAGAHDFLTKPFDNVEVELRVRNVLRTKHLHDELERQRSSLEERVAERTAELEAANRELLALDQLKRDFIAMVSHEMRTPLTVVNGFTELLSHHWDHFDQDRRNSQIDVMRRNTARLERLVDNLLQAATIEAGMHAEPPDVQQTNVGAVIDEVVEDSNIDPSKVELAGDAEATLHVEAETLRTVLSNLLSNANKYGAPPFQIDVTANSEVTIAVRDHGTGVPAEFADKLFEQFSQASVGDRRTATGAGLGLWIARQLARRHRGDLTYEPADPGAVFRLQLPRHTP